MTGLDWPGLMRAGLYRLGLAPDVFWALTPVELQIMLGHAQGRPAINRARLAELLADFPDPASAPAAGRPNMQEGSDGGK